MSPRHKARRLPPSTLKSWISNSPRTALSDVGSHLLPSSTVSSHSSPIVSIPGTAVHPTIVAFPKGTGPHESGSSLDTTSSSDGGDEGKYSGSFGRSTGQVLSSFGPTQSAALTASPHSNSIAGSPPTFGTTHIQAGPGYLHPNIYDRDSNMTDVSLATARQTSPDTRTSTPATQRSTSPATRPVSPLPTQTTDAPGPNVTPGSTISSVVADTGRSESANRTIEGYRFAKTPRQIRGT
ncbi:hypothetical protein BCR39DRAFT_46554 [Naematelia encephala]|uniref:Uncharacterized protein n=1 Tax=Naematelia encephala TaxID=71784 RepID=A0A1Y2BBV7_9TREE|nr:hypothetical protein BCR39DRAFT_46554 [Naematelia encephala]